MPYRHVEEMTYSDSGNLAQKKVYLQVAGYTPWTSEAIDTNYTRNNEGQVTAVTVKRGTTTDASYSYAYDSLGRLQSMSGDSTVSNVTYNAAGQILSMTHNGLQETRQYNVMQQLTRLTIAGQMDLEYRYPASGNNGQITSMKNWVSGEEVNYSYDSLSRLSAATTTGPEWGLSFTYDGFGNKTAQTVTKGSGPAMSIAVDSNNRVVGHSYDAAGNTTAMPGMTMAWDSFGRMRSAAVSGGQTDSYGYDSANLRVLKNGRYFARGGAGEVLAEYTFDAGTHTFTYQKKYGYFAGKVTGQKEDRLGTVQTGSRVYPYGEEVPATGQDTQKFATYYRDAGTGLDYARARYYASSSGRFLRSDPHYYTSPLLNSQEWNRYSFVIGDPINNGDPNGEFFVPIFSGLWTWLSGIFGLAGQVVSSLPPSVAQNSSPFPLKADPEWTRNPVFKITAWDALIASAVAAAILRDQSQDGRQRYPAYLLLVEDCYQAGGYGGSALRVRRYWLFDQYNERFVGANVGIQEHNYVVHGELSGANSRSQGGEFLDFLSKGAYGGDAEWIAFYQQFTVQITGGLDATNGSFPVKVRVPGVGEWGTLGFHLRKNTVWANDVGEQARNGTCPQKYF